MQKKDRGQKVTENFKKEGAKCENLNHIFREYDIRGKVGPEGINEVSIAKIATAFAYLLRQKNVQEVVVGYDNRAESFALANTAANVLKEAGFKVWFLGLTLSPAAYFAQHWLKARGVFMVTASHNPNGWNGCKLGYDLSSTLDAEDMVILKKLYENLTASQKPDQPLIRPGGSRKDFDIRPHYINTIIQKVKIPKNHGLKVVIDAGNGAAGLFAYQLFQALGCLTFQLNCDPDPAYPHYFPNPSDLASRERLAAMVTHPYIKADLGISFDGDGDRLGVVDENGKNVWSDRILMILAEQILKEVPGAKIVYDVKCTKALEETIIAKGGKPIMAKTGHSYIKKKLAQTGALLAGERSGHIFIKQGYYGYDDALFAAAKLCLALAKEQKPLSQVLAAYPSYVTSPEINVYCPDGQKYQVVESLQKEFIAAYGENRVNTINGARVSYKRGWGLVRASSNLPQLVMIFEGENEAAQQEIKEDFASRLKKYPQISDEWENNI